MSSKFSRRPRVQPSPKICKKTPIYPGVTPPPGPWPPTTIIATIDWDCWLPYPLAFHVHSTQTVTWDDLVWEYAAWTPTAPQLAKWRFHIDKPSGESFVTMIGDQPGGPYYSCLSANFWIPLNDPIAVDLTVWQTSPPFHEIRFQGVG